MRNNRAPDKPIEMVEREVMLKIAGWRVHGLLFGLLDIKANAH